MAKYFTKYPIIFYNGQYARNLMTRAKLSDATISNVRLFYPYNIRDGENFADIIADKYYKDPYYDWVVGLSNQIVDPYYDYPLDSSTFDDFIAGKYGSVDTAKQTILFYQNNWADDDSILTVSAYDALSDSLKKYWTASLDYTGAVSGYVRKQEDWVCQTNRIVQIATPSPTPTIGQIYTSGGATGTVCYVDSTYTQLCNVTGTFASSTVLSESLADTESAYWSPVYAYDYEASLNEDKRNIKLVDSRYLFDVEQELAKALK